MSSSYGILHKSNPMLQIPPARNDAQLAPQRTDESAVPAQRQYDERQAELISASLPSGVITNEISVRDPVALMEATKSANFTGFVFLGGHTVDLDDLRGEKEYHSFQSGELLLSNRAVVLPKTVRRRSVKDLKRQVRIGKTIGAVLM